MSARDLALLLVFALAWGCAETDHVPTPIAEVEPARGPATSGGALLAAHAASVEPGEQRLALYLNDTAMGTVRYTLKREEAGWLVSLEGRRAAFGRVITLEAEHHLDESLRPVGGSQAEFDATEKDAEPTLLRRVSYEGAEGGGLLVTRTIDDEAIERAEADVDAISGFEVTFAALLLRGEEDKTYALRVLDPRTGDAGLLHFRRSAVDVHEVDGLRHRASLVHLEDPKTRKGELLIDADTGEVLRSEMERSLIVIKRAPADGN